METNQTTETEAMTTELNAWMDLGESLANLRRNPDFKKVIEEGYLRNKALDSVSLLSHPQIKDAGKRTDVMEDLISISNLQLYFKMIEDFSAAAKDDYDNLITEG
jgi:hypothetical protein